VPAPSPTAIAVFLILALGACAGAGIHPRVYMVEEDSHPHEVRPGTEARFHVPAVAGPRRVDVKCALRGPAGPVRLVFFGIRPEGWAKRHPVIDVGAKETFVDIEGIAEPGHGAPFFAFANDDPARLLWHQCYNN